MKTVEQLTYELYRNLYHRNDGAILKYDELDAVQKKRWARFSTAALALKDGCKHPRDKTNFRDGEFKGEIDEDGAIDEVCPCGAVRNGRTHQIDDKHETIYWGPWE